jgi:hypothetical protein
VSVTAPHVLFVSPQFPAAQRLFLRALKAEGARLTGIGVGRLADPELRALLDGYERVVSLDDDEAIAAAARRAGRRRPVHHLEATDERHVLPTARARERLGLPGLSARAALAARDKATMKDALRGAGLPVAQSAPIATAADLEAFAARVGYPLVLKPRAGFGALGAARLDTAADLGPAVVRLRGQPAVAEEFVEGHEGFFDTLAFGGEVVHEFVSHYYPNVLEALGDRRIAPQMVTTNRLGAESYRELRRVGRQAIAALGIDGAPTHMEWFFGPKGLKVSEIAARPAGDRIWDLYSTANEIDLYAEWAHLVVRGRPRARPSRRYAAGLVQVRPDRDGCIHRYRGLDEVLRMCGPSIVARQVPAVGSPTHPLAMGYLGNAWFILRHEDYDELRRRLDFVGRTLRIEAG